MELGDGVYRDMIELKFVEGSGVRLRGRKLVSLTGTNISPAIRLLDQYPAVRVDRMFRDVPEEKLTLDKLNGELKTGWELADLNLWYVCYLSGNEDPIDFLNNLNNLDMVEIAYPSPIAEPAEIQPDEILPFDIMTPDFTDMQGYLYDAPVGIEAEYAWTFEGGRGAQMKWIDIEVGWNWDHEDIPIPFYIGGYYPRDNHGTAVVGEVSGVANDFGITGIASDALAGSVTYYGYPDNLAACFYQAYEHLDEGDVFLIELHAPGPNGIFICMEYWQANFDAIQTITANGVHCTEAAGNGGADYDDPIYEGRFNRNLRDSGAIICGAGDPMTLERLWFSCYGSRLDSQGWGQNVVTTGYCDLYGNFSNECYTSVFSGTSSASPMMTGSVLCVQGFLKSRGEPVMTPLELRSLLRVTGSPPPDIQEYIGTRPNLRAAFDWIINTPRDRIIEIPEDYPTIQEGIDAGRDGDTVLVHPGIYVENINFNGHNVVVGSLFLTSGDTSFISSTIIDGGSSGSVVTFESDEDDAAVIAGFTIRNGFASQGGGIYCDGSSPRIEYNSITENSSIRGGGIYCVNDANPVIRHNMVIDNSASEFGAGLYCHLESRPEIIENTIRGNSADSMGGGIALSFSNPTILNNTIEGNVAGSRGGGVSCNSSSPAMSNNSINGNEAVNGGGVYIGNSSNVELYDNILSGNIASGTVEISHGGAISFEFSEILIFENTISENEAIGNGGGIYSGDSSAAIITNNSIFGNSGYKGGGIYCENSNTGISKNLISGNESEDGGGIYCGYQASPDIANNIIFMNMTGAGGGIYCSSSAAPIILNNSISENISYRGGGIYCGASSSPVLKNNILWADTAGAEGLEIYVHESATPIVVYSDIEGGWVGEGNIDIDPLFRDVDSGDFHLMSFECGDTVDSPCIDVGHPAILDNILNCDWGMATRLSDMGAFGGGDSARVGIENPDSESPIDFTLTQNYPNPFNPYTAISFELPRAQRVTLKIYDLLGREVAMALDEKMPAGIHRVEFDGSDLASGVYFYILETGDFVDSKRMVLIK